MKETLITNLKTQLRAGNTDCLKEIFEKHGDYCVKNLIRKTGCTTEQAEDIFIDAIINFRDKILSDKIKYLTSMRSYIFATCMNMQLANRYQKGRFERKKYDIESTLYNTDQSDYLTTTINKEYEEELMRLSTVTFEALDERCRTILRLFYVYHYSMVEIADKMDMATKDVAKTTKARCFKKWSKLVTAYLEKKA